MRHLDLFSGIGGFALAAHWLGIETQQFVEIDPYCQKVLAKNFPGIAIHDDITTFTGDRGRYDLVTGGWPCQDVSSANPSGRGLEGKRSGLFYELMRVVSECRPNYIVLENVHALLTGRKGRDMGAVLWELSQCGYDAEWQTVSAASVGAEHLRARVFVVAYPNSACKRGKRGWEQNKLSWPSSKKRGFVPVQVPGFLCSKLWKMPSNSCRGGNGISSRLDRFRGLGNAVVPQCAAIALQRVLQLEREAA
ncbi:MAG: DNA cytosine methyltransferase [Cyanobacteria bacterium P01_F01_bin.150]